MQLQILKTMYDRRTKVMMKNIAFAEVLKLKDQIQY